MPKRRVVVTGLGQISPVGNYVAEAWRNLLAGQSGIHKITSFDASEYSCQIAGSVRGFDVARTGIAQRYTQHMDLFIQYGLAAAYQAILDAGLDEDRQLDPTRVGINIGSGIGGVAKIEENAGILKEKGPKRLSPFFLPGALANMTSGCLSMLKGYRGPSYAIVSACATGSHAIGNAMRMIQYGDADVIICGGSESAITPLGIGGFSAMRALSSKYNDAPSLASRPWDKDRDGFVVGEGAGVLVLEEYEHAFRRGANVYAELCGFGMNSDAYHLTMPRDDGSGAAQGMTVALRDAGIHPEDVDYINAHATSTKLGDIAEARAITLCFQAHAKQLAVSSTKSMTGHLLGGAGGIEAIYTVLSIRDQVCPPTINLDNPDEGCDLDFVPHHARDMKIDVALCNSFGFGGTNASLVFRKLL